MSGEDEKEAPGSRLQAPGSGSAASGSGSGSDSGSGSEPSHVPPPPIREASPEQAASDLDAVRATAARRSRHLRIALFSTLLVAGLVAIVVGLLVRRDASSGRAADVIIADDGGVIGPGRPDTPKLPAPRRGPGDQRLSGTVVDTAGAPVT